MESNNIYFVYCSIVSALYMIVAQYIFMKSNEPEWTY